VWDVHAVFGEDEVTENFQGAATPQASGEPATAKATANGHTVEWDPPASLTAARRWTCTRCGDAVLDYNGNVYGGAVDRTCDESVAFWGRSS